MEAKSIVGCLRIPDPTVRRAVAKTGALVANLVGFLALFQAYKLVRRTFIVRAETLGFHPADQVISLQQRLHLFIEPDVQSWAMRNEWLIRGLNWNYAGFMWAFCVCSGAAALLAPVRFRELRRVFLLSMAIALPWFAIYPLAPPRFMTEYGLVDTMRIHGPNYFSKNGMVAANQFAAMPSMHIGWTTIGAFMLAAAFPRRRIGAMLGGVIVALMTLTIVATGNHYLLDVVGGWIVVATSFAAARVLPRRAVDRQADGVRDRERRSLRSIGDRR